MPQRKRPEPEENATNTLSEEKINSYIDGIYEGSITEENLPEDVYEAIAKYLKKGLYKGYNMNLSEAEEIGGKDFELLSQLRENTYMFSAAKTYAMTKEISSLLVDEDGNVRTSKEFNEIGRSTYDNWNNNYGETEYSTAIGQAYAAEQWVDIERTKDILPNLTYSAIGDACEICGPLDGLTAPIDDPIWRSCTPLNHFNCKCILMKEDDEAQLTSDEEKQLLLGHAENKMDPMFNNNPGQTGLVFTKDHPYFEEARADKMGKDNFNLPIPEKD